MASLTRHVMVTTVGNLLTRVSGIAREVLLASLLGSTMQADAFHAALRVPGLFRDLFAEGSMSNAFVPTFARAMHHKGLKDAWALANALLGVLLLILGVLTLAMGLFPGPWVSAVAWGFHEVEGKAELTASLIVLVAPFLAFVSFASLFGGMLNTRERFLIPSVAPAMFNLAIIAACIAPQSWLNWLWFDRVTLLAVAATCGGALQAIVQLPSLWKEGYRIRPHLRGHPELGRLVRFLAPALLGIATIQIGILVDLQFAASLGDGPISWLRYAFQIAQLPMNLFGGAIAVVGIAALSNLVAQGDLKQARLALHEATGLTLFLVLPIGALFFIFAEPIVALLYERNAFTTDDTLVTSTLLQCYATGVLAFALHRVFTPAFFAWEDPWTPMVTGAASIVLKIPLVWWASRPERWGVHGIATVHVFVTSIEVLVLFGLLSRRTGGWSSQFWSTAARITLASLVPLFFGLWSKSWVTGPLSLFGVLVLCGVGYLASAWLLRLPQIALVKRWVLGIGQQADLPPHLDPQTADALRTHQAAQWVDAHLRDGVLEVHTSHGVLVCTSEEGILKARHQPLKEAPPESHTPPLQLTCFLDTDVHPPPLHGLKIQVGSTERSWCAHGDHILEDIPVGPQLTPKKQHSVLE